MINIVLILLGSKSNGFVWLRWMDKNERKSIQKSFGKKLTQDEALKEIKKIKKQK